MRQSSEYRIGTCRNYWRKILREQRSRGSIRGDVDNSYHEFVVRCQELGHVVVTPRVNNVRTVSVHWYETLDSRPVFYSNVTNVSRFHFRKRKRTGKYFALWKIAYSFFAPVKIEISVSVSAVIREVFRPRFSPQPILQKLNS